MKSQIHEYQKKYSKMSKTIITLVFIAFSYLGFAQLIDPFGKIITHEIKLKKLDNGMYAGAMEWTTGGVDSLQKFIINGLDIKAPVMVRIISKAPDHNIDLSFHKKDWDKIESKISTDGNKFANKIFRTMNIAGLGVHSKVAGIPYLITVKVGLQFPSTKSLIRITDDKEEYTKHLRKMGFGGAVFEDHNTSSSSSETSPSNEFSNDDNNTLTYVVIGLLVAIIVLLIIFLIKRKSSKNATLLLLIFCSIQFSISQNSQPKLVPISGQGESPVFFEYQNQNVGNQEPVADTNSNQNEAKGPDKDGRVYTPVRIELGSGVKELSGEEADEINSRIREANEEFDSNYGENSPGEPTEGDQRILPLDRINEELNTLRRQVQNLQQQVELLSQEDEAFEQDNDAGGEILLYCEDLVACRICIQRGFHKFNTHRAYFNFLQKYYLKKVTDLNDWIEYGNALSSLPGGGGMAWTPVLLHKVRPAMDNLKKAYNKKFDEYIVSMELDLEEVSACYSGNNGRFRSRDGYEFQMFAILNALKASKIHK